MTTRFASGREILVGRGIPQPVPIALEPAAYAGAFAYGEDGIVYYCDGAAWIHADGRRPQRVVSSAYTAVLADAGRVISIAAGGVTIPAGVFSAGHKFSVLNNSPVTQDIVPAAGVALYLSGTAATGPQTLGPRGLVEVECIGTDSFVMSGTGSVTPNPEGVTLVAPNFFSTPLTLQRAQLTGVQSSAINGTNDGLTLYGADVPRFTGSAQRLLIEGQSTNGFWNPQLEGAVAGSPGTLPSRTAYGTFPTGVTASVVGVGVEGDMNYVDIRYQGTAASSNRCVYFLENGGTIIASVGQTWTASIYAKVVAGAWPGTTPLFQINEQNSGGTLVTQANLATAAIASGSTPLAQARLRATHTLTGAATAAIRPALVTGILSIGTVVDVTFRVAVPQIELGAFASSPILPPVGTPGASTRGDDIVSASLSSLGIAANGACTVLWSGVVPNFITGGVHTIACIDDGSVSNRFTMRIDQASGQLQSMRALAGASATANAGAVTAGIAFKAGMTANGAGRVAVSLNGGAAVNVTGGPTAGLTRFRHGNIADLSTPLWGETGRLRVLPYVVSDAELAVLTGALP